MVGHTVENLCRIFGKSVVLSGNVQILSPPFCTFLLPFHHQRPTGNLDLQRESTQYACMAHDLQRESTVLGLGSAHKGVPYYTVVLVRGGSAGLLIHRRPTAGIYAYTVRRLIATAGIYTFRHIHYNVL
jgi:hypothetical protein